MEVNHHIAFKSDEYKEFINYIETLKRQKVNFTLNGNIFSDKNKENSSYSVNWITEEAK